MAAESGRHPTLRDSLIRAASVGRGEIAPSANAVENGQILKSAGRLGHSPQHASCVTSQARTNWRRSLFSEVPYQAIEPCTSSRSVPIVRIRPGKKGSMDAPPGAYVVTKLLPKSGGEFGYQIRSSLEGHDRVVKESQLQAMKEAGRSNQQGNYRPSKGI
jgi:hypothetical protein